LNSILAKNLSEQRHIGAPLKNHFPGGFGQFELAGERLAKRAHARAAGADERPVNVE
jgi:hypothetical protein